MTKPKTIKSVEEVVDEIDKLTARCLMGGAAKNVEFLVKQEVKNWLTQALLTERQAIIEKIKPLVERVRLDVDVIVCDCGEKYKDSDLDFILGDLEKEISRLQEELKDKITMNTNKQGIEKWLKDTMKVETCPNCGEKSFVFCSICEKAYPPNEPCQHLEDK